MDLKGVLYTGGIPQEWTRLGRETGICGYPVSDEINVNDGWQSDFKHGSIVFSKSSTKQPPAKAGGFV